MMSRQPSQTVDGDYGMFGVGEEWWTEFALAVQRASSAEIESLFWIWYTATTAVGYRQYESTDENIKEFFRLNLSNEFPDGNAVSFLTELMPMQLSADMDKFDAGGFGVSKYFPLLAAISIRVLKGQPDFPKRTEPYQFQEELLADFTDVPGLGAFFLGTDIQYRVTATVTGGNAVLERLRNATGSSVDFNLATDIGMNAATEFLQSHPFNPE